MGFSASHGISCVEVPWYKVPVGQAAKFIMNVKCKQDKFHRDSHWNGTLMHNQTNGISQCRNITNYYFQTTNCSQSTYTTIMNRSSELQFGLYLF
jgi:hypothetical protein